MNTDNICVFVPESLIRKQLFKLDKYIVFVDFQKASVECPEVICEGFPESLTTRNFLMA